jgi:hypothetical protein
MPLFCEGGACHIGRKFEYISCFDDRENPQCPAWIHPSAEAATRMHDEAHVAQCGLMSLQPVSLARGAAHGPSQLAGATLRNRDPTGAGSGCHELVFGRATGASLE